MAKLINIKEVLRCLELEIQVGKLFLFKHLYVMMIYKHFSPDFSSGKVFIACVMDGFSRMLMKMVLI